MKRRVHAWGVFSPGDDVPWTLELTKRNAEMAAIDGDEGSITRRVIIEYDDKVTISKPVGKP
jgi:hypothetical protein